MKRESNDPQRRSEIPYPLLAPRLWQGMRMGHLARLLIGHRFAVRPGRMLMAGAMVPCSIGNSLLHGLQQMIFGRRIGRTALAAPPLFIIGHWRTGTTYLHELLACDRRFAAPGNYACFAASHFLVSRWIIGPLLAPLLPKARLTDSVAVQLDGAQEDEFALCALGAPSPYLRIAFPGDPAPHLALLDMTGVTAEDRQRLAAAIRYFYQAVTLQHGKQLLIKSPVHTGRIAFLTELFPGSRFIHLTRHPYDVFASTRRLWQAMDEAHGFHRGEPGQLDEYVHACYERMYRGFECQRRRVDPGAVVDVRYDDLVRDPLGTAEQVYERLKLGGFDQAREAMRTYVQQAGERRPASHTLDEATRAAIDARWAGYFERYGYAKNRR